MPVRSVAVLALVLAMAACSPEDNVVTSSTPSPPTTSSNAMATSTTYDKGDEPDGESIGVTDSVTIVVIDPDEDR